MLVFRVQIVRVTESGSRVVVESTHPVVEVIEGTAAAMGWMTRTADKAIIEGPIALMGYTIEPRLRSESPARTM